MRVTEIPVQQVAATEGTRPLPSLVEWGVAAQEYPGHGLVHWCQAIPNVYLEYTCQLYMGGPHTVQDIQSRESCKVCLKC